MGGKTGGGSDGDSRGKSSRNSVASIMAQWGEARPDLDCRPMATIGQIWRTGALLTREVSANLKNYDLDMPGFDVLMTLRRQAGLAPMNPTALASDMMLSPPAMTNRLDRLEARGLIRRQANGEDRRSIRIALTDAGLALVDKAIESHLAVENQLLKGLSLKERETLLLLLTRIGD